MDDPRLIRLAESDNVLVIATSLDAGTRLALGNSTVELAEPLSLGHKIAARPIVNGEIVLKYNFPIGIATSDIALGEHVHVHNMRSDYTPTYVIPEA